MVMKRTSYFFVLTFRKYRGNHSFNVELFNKNSVHTAIQDIKWSVFYNIYPLDCQTTQISQAYYNQLNENNNQRA